MTNLREGTQPGLRAFHPARLAAAWRNWWPFAVAVLYSAAMGSYLMHVGSWDLSVPWSYPFPTYDEVWQLHLTKSLLDTGWILHNPLLGAPGAAEWYINAAPQTSSLHSVLMLLLGLFIDDAVRVQQVYFLLNFPLIAAATYCSARVLRIGRVPAMLVAILFAFLTYRFTTQIYSFLANYFCIPLALIPVFWTMLGRYADEADSWGPAFLRVLTTRAFLVGAAVTIVVVLSDGYYAFFTLLLLGFAVAVRLLGGDWRRPSRLLAPIALIVLLIGLATAMMLPLKNYQASHREEFYPGGVIEPSMVKRPFEAEVYSSTLKMLMAPIPGAHRVPALAEVGNKLLASSNEVSKFNRGSVMPLGLLGSGLLLLSFGLIAVQATGRRMTLGRGDVDEQMLRVVWVSIALALFAFLCTIQGGIGTLIAFVYPSIRAYERFGVFLVLILYLGAAAAATAFIQGASGNRSRVLRSLLVVLVGLIAHADQVPVNTWRGKEEDGKRFLAERKFVREIESQLPSGAMVYNYPYSQYLTNSPYYGWGAYGQIRLYLHSHMLRWSNGSGKNTPVEQWHGRQAAQSPEALFTAMAAAGFSAVVVDRMVVGDEEYAKLKQAAVLLGVREFKEDADSRSTFFALPDPGYRLVYDADFRAPVALEIRDRKAFDDGRRLATEINRQGVVAALQRHPGTGAIRLDAGTEPGIFRDMQKLMQGAGTTSIDMAKLEGGLQCEVGQDGNVRLTLHNGSDFPWTLNAGDKPLTIGVNLLASDQSVLLWDPSLRVKDRAEVAEGQSISLGYPLDSLKQQAIPVSNGKPVFARLALLQEGNAWSPSINCSIQVTP